MTSSLGLGVEAREIAVVTVRLQGFSHNHSRLVLGPNLGCVRPFVPLTTTLALNLC